ncbi:MAG: hypothetical protein KDJ37_12500 [Hyphomicrobiaceae bacterium]|nr:hypothetical protein [Hyphomicrobiaceae bacterium]
MTQSNDMVPEQKPGANFLRRTPLLGKPPTLDIANRSPRLVALFAAAAWGVASITTAGFPVTEGAAGEGKSMTRPTTSTNTSPATSDDGVSSARSGLPFSRGRTFETLDAYLAHLKELSKMDISHYEQIGPDTFRKKSMIRPKPGQKVVFTRAELMAKFGFTK